MTGNGAALDPHTPHPAKYSDPIVELLTELLAYHTRFPGPIVDPFAGTGRIHHLGRDDTYGIELEPEWAHQHPRTTVGDATSPLPWPDHIGTICTSPTYGNRMADTYAGDGTRRHTYRIALGRDLTPNNTGGLQWGDTYRDLHRAAWWHACTRLTPGGAFILNISDHIRQGARQYVTDWHLRRIVLDHGLAVEDYHRIETRRQRHGANGDARVDHEAVIVLRKLHA